MPKQLSCLLASKEKTCKDKIDVCISTNLCFLSVYVHYLCFSLIDALSLLYSSVSIVHMVCLIISMGYIVGIGEQPSYKKKRNWGTAGKCDINL